MDERIYNDETFRILKMHHRKNVSRATRPLFIFSCGGNEKYHSSRRQIANYVATNRECKNMFCVTAESLAGDEFKSIFGGLDFLKLEALIADIADCILLFCESAGAICELGAFSVLDSVCPMLSVGISKEHKGSDSFIIEGPIRKIEDLAPKPPLANVFYLDLECPLTSVSLTNYIHGIRSAVTKEKQIKHPKRINNTGEKIEIGALALELLDLVYLFHPISQNDLIDVYRKLKGFSNGSDRLHSRTISEEMKIDEKIQYRMIIAFMLASNIIGKNESGLYPLIKLGDYFMFARTDGSSFVRMQSSVLLRKRSMERIGAASVYNRAIAQ